MRVFAAMFSTFVTFFVMLEKFIKAGDHIANVAVAYAGGYEDEALEAREDKAIARAAERAAKAKAAAAQP